MLVFEDTCTVVDMDGVVAICSAGAAGHSATECCAERGVVGWREAGGELTYSANNITFCFTAA